MNVFASLTDLKFRFLHEVDTTILNYLCIMNYELVKSLFRISEMV